MRLDVVIPAHNEEMRLDPTLRAYRAALSDEGVRFLIALDDCTDGTADIVRRHAATDDRVVLLEFPKLGKGGVLMEAFRYADAPLVGFVDADCATPPFEMHRLAEVAAMHDGAIASRYHSASMLPVRRPMARSVLARVSRLIIERLFHLGYRDTQCGAKMFRHEVIEAALPLLSARDFLFDVDLLVTARKLGYEVKEVPTVWVDQAGSTVQRSDARKTLTSALRLWMHHKAMPAQRINKRPTTLSSK